MGMQYGMGEGDKDTKRIKDRMKQFISLTVFDKSCALLLLLLILLHYYYYYYYHQIY
jgi:hypothetical protein